MSFTDIRAYASSLAFFSSGTFGEVFTLVNFYNGPEYISKRTAQVFDKTPVAELFCYFFFHLCLFSDDRF